MPTIRLNGFDAYYEDHGGGGEPLVLVHGYTGDLTDWEHQIRAFAPQFRVVAMDNRGHGRSSAPPAGDGYTIEEMATDVRALLDGLGLDRVHLAGHSLGGMVAQAFAVTWPERLRSLVLVDSPPFSNMPEAVAYRERCFQVARTQGMAAVVEFQEANAPFRPPIPVPPEERERGRRRLAAMSVEGYVGAGLALCRWPGVVDRLGEVTAPTLIIVGEHESPAMHRGVALLAERLPGARLVTIPGAGHTPQREATAAFNEALSAFLAAVAAPPGER
ncbi:MAG TPA: alpha/beta fold hydrolase [Dehalococcoidia bacterium]